MQIQISLKDTKRHPFWLLGNNPKRLKAQLSTVNRGPVKLDFDDLHEFEQKQVLNSLNAGIIEVDRGYSELYQVFLQAQTPPPPTDPASAQFRTQELLRVQSQERLKMRAEHEEKEKKFVDHCRFLSKQNTRALKANTHDSKELRLFRTLRNLEGERKKPRASVLDYLSERIKSLQADLVRQAEEVKPFKGPGHKANPYDKRVVNSEKEVVHFTQKQIDDLMEEEVQVVKAEVDITDEDLTEFTA